MLQGRYEVVDKNGSNYKPNIWSRSSVLWYLVPPVLGILFSDNVNILESSGTQTAMATITVEPVWLRCNSAPRVHWTYRPFPLFSTSINEVQRYLSSLSNSSSRVKSISNNITAPICPPIHLGSSIYLYIHFRPSISLSYNHPFIHLNPILKLVIYSFVLHLDSFLFGELLLLLLLPLHGHWHSDEKAKLIHNSDKAKRNQWWRHDIDDAVDKDDKIEVWGRRRKGCGLRWQWSREIGRSVQ